MTGPTAVLIGAPGSGKTTIGELLAGRLGVGFRDTDADVERTAGKPVSDIFLADGEARFRELERAAVRSALTEHDGVLALGGGAILDPETRRLLSDHTVVYLQVGLGEAIKRVGLAQSRPLLMVNPRGQLKVLLDERLPIYRRLATLTVDTEGRTPAQVVEEILRAMRERRE